MINQKTSKVRFILMFPRIESEKMLLKVTKISPSNSELSYLLLCFLLLSLLFCKKLIGFF